MCLLAGLFSSLLLSTEILILLSLVLMFNIVRFIRRHSPAESYTREEMECFHEAAENALGKSEYVFHEHSGYSHRYSLDSAA